MKPKFSLGRVVATPGALNALEESGESPGVLLNRHSQNDWGDLCEEDKMANESALKNGARILSAYRLKDGTKIWLITDAVVDEFGNRQATTILLPEEY